MFNGHNIVVTLTSWKGRIEVCALSIYNFLMQQTVKPDKFFLWLSEEEFPSKEAELPPILVKLVKVANILLRWLPGNELVYKRWHVFPKYYNDYVFSIDDDCVYSRTVIKDALVQMCQYPNSPCNLWKVFSAIPCYNNDIKITFKYSSKDNDLLMWLCGNVAFPPGTFPLEAITPEAVKIRDLYAMFNDETWLMPYLLKNNTSISKVLNYYPFKTYKNTLQNGLFLVNGKHKDENGYSNKEKALYLMLKHTGMLELYKTTHIGYDYSKYLMIYDNQTI